MTLAASWQRKFFHHCKRRRCNMKSRQWSFFGTFYRQEVEHIATWSRQIFFKGQMRFMRGVDNAHIEHPVAVYTDVRTLLNTPFTFVYGQFYRAAPVHETIYPQALGLPRKEVVAEG